MTTREDLHETRFFIDKFSIPFIQNVQSIFESRKKQLEILSKSTPIMRFGRDQNTIAHNWLYTGHIERQEYYKSICSSIVRDIFKEPCYYQSIPCYRVGFPGNRWVGSFHRDSDFGHSNSELNVILALTDMHDSSALHVETSPGSFKYQSLNMKQGEFIVFNHIDLLHGCKINRTGKIVMSIDFRFIPLSASVSAFASPGVTVNSSMLMKPGGYFSANILSP